MKVRISLTVEVDEEAWAETYHLAPEDVREDVVGHVREAVVSLEGVPITISRMSTAATKAARRTTQKVASTKRTEKVVAAAFHATAAARVILVTHNPTSNENEYACQRHIDAQKDATVWDEGTPWEPATTFAFEDVHCYFGGEHLSDDRCQAI